MPLAMSILAAAVLLAAPAPARAGELNFTPYVWIPGINGSMGTDTGGEPGRGDRKITRCHPSGADCSL